jgi:hypothetical protein
MAPAPYRSGMTTSSKFRCAVYAAIALIALVATWSQNIAYLDSMSSFLPDFLADLTVNAGARSITADILLFLLAAAVLMVVEARKHGVRFVWAYIAAGFLIAISVTFPLFLIARELRISDGRNIVIAKVDAALLAVLTVGVLAGTIWVVTH